LTKKRRSDQLEDIIDIQDQSIMLSEVESIASSTEEKDNKDGLYSSILLSLTHETYPKNKAKLFWAEIIEDMKNLEHALGRKVGISVATLDYLSNIKKYWMNPK